MIDCGVGMTVLVRISFLPPETKRIGALFVPSFLHCSFLPSTETLDVMHSLELLQFVWACVFKGWPHILCSLSLSPDSDWVCWKQRSHDFISLTWAHSICMVSCHLNLWLLFRRKWRRQGSGWIIAVPMPSTIPVQLLYNEWLILLGPSVLGMD